MMATNIICLILTNMVVVKSRQAENPSPPFLILYLVFFSFFFFFFFFESFHDE